MGGFIDACYDGENVSVGASLHAGDNSMVAFYEEQADDDLVEVIHWRVLWWLRGTVNTFWRGIHSHDPECQGHGTAYCRSFL